MAQPPLLDQGGELRLPHDFPVSSDDLSDMISLFKEGKNVVSFYLVIRMKSPLVVHHLIVLSYATRVRMLAVREVRVLTVTDLCEVVQLLQSRVSLQVK